MTPFFLFLPSSNKQIEKIKKSIEEFQLLPQQKKNTSVWDNSLGSLKSKLQFSYQSIGLKHREGDMTEILVALVSGWAFTNVLSSLMEEKQVDSRVGEGSAFTITLSQEKAKTSIQRWHFHERCEIEWGPLFVYLLDRLSNGKKKEKVWRLCSRKDYGVSGFTHFFLRYFLRQGVYIWFLYMLYSSKRGKVSMSGTRKD